MYVARQVIQRSTLQRSRHVVFQVSEARRALPYISRAVSDIHQAYKTAKQCRAALKRHLSADEKFGYEQMRDNALTQLNRAIDECDSVGANVVDLANGTVRFESRTQGRAISLVWRLGEPIHNAWPDVAE